jgi:hypothetical protein
MRRLTIACAALGLAATALVATSPAQASYKVIRWDGTGFCQIWDNAVPTKPFPSDYKTVSRSVPTFMNALATKDRLFHAAKCTL